MGAGERESRQPDPPGVEGTVSRAPMRLGVLGTLVWDRIVGRDSRREPVEEWGGLSYSLEALSLALPDGWIAEPLLKVGEDLSEPALGYLRSIPRVEVDPGVRVVPFPNNRV